MCVQRGPGRVKYLSGLNPAASFSQNFTKTQTHTHTHTHIHTHMHTHGVSYLFSLCFSLPLCRSSCLLLLPAFFSARTTNQCGTRRLLGLENAPQTSAPPPKPTLRKPRRCVKPLPLPGVTEPSIQRPSGTRTPNAAELKLPVTWNSTASVMTSMPLPSNSARVVGALPPLTCSSPFITPSSRWGSTAWTNA